MKTGVVIILFHPDTSHLSRMLETLIDSGYRVVLVDNSPHELKLALPQEVVYLHYPQNIGIAAAQNRGLSHLAGQQFSHAVLFDQDSAVTPALMEGLCAGFVEAQAHFGKVAAVGPQIICEFYNQPVKPKVQQAVDVRDGLASVKQIIASGMMLSLSELETIGHKEESLFIDGVDHEWCWRARDKGFSVVKLTDVTMLHKQGDGRHKVLGITFKRGAPVRLYYQVRNVLILSRRSYVPLYWKLRNIPAIPLRWLINRWVFDNGKQRGRYFAKGLVDGLKGKNGPLE
ncbi:glycosyltransferase family 2 protein [Alteromonas sp. RKMC-009]|uniref:glycosyltransferase family 2 protein n=1 Tax=Alteromonas sp. RKMC-009 TaxID=2267264 RepID=UPI000E69189F|nr:glycosyltransferase family 2 protein [Alteromonas sp. RKMC-009]AYA63591.1 glycosyltransferase family 2 protein [Alteromonas sp. RKMC-009]